MTQGTEADVPRPLGNRAKQRERVRIDSKLLEEGMFEGTEDVESALVGMLRERNNIPDQFSVATPWWALDFRVPKRSGCDMVDLSFPLHLTAHA
jgi:hypothetical protein